MEKQCVLLAVDVLLDIFLERDAQARVLWELIQAQEVECFHTPATALNVFNAVQAETSSAVSAFEVLNRMRSSIQVCPVIQSNPELEPFHRREPYTDPQGEHEAIQELTGAVSMRLDAIVTRTRKILYAAVASKYPRFCGLYVPILPTHQLLARITESLKPGHVSVPRQDSANLTQLLIDWGNGDSTVLPQLRQMLLGEMKSLAHHFLHRYDSNWDVRVMPVIEEAFSQLLEQKQTAWRDRAHFLCDTALLVRRILIDRICTNPGPRYGRDVGLPWMSTGSASPRFRLNLLALDCALERLAALDPQRHKIVELDVMCGLTESETAEVLGLGVEVVRVDRDLATIWLWREMGGRRDG